MRTAFVLLVTLSSVLAEQYFELRNRQDNTRYRTFNDRNIITSEEKAEEVLVRYGYLRCGGKRRKDFKKHRLAAETLQEGAAPSIQQQCTPKELQKAIRMYQRNYNMPVTGVLDEATLQVMSESRCGNPDIDSNSPFFHGAPKNRKHFRRKSRGHKRVRRNTTLVQNPPSVEDIVFGRPSKVSSSEQPLPKGTTHGRRKRWLVDYIQRTQSAEGTAKLLSEERHQKIQSLRRSKRSVSSGVEGQAFNKQVVSWRLISSAYSNQLTLDTQRAAIALAFRMWAEVIPLVFEEDFRSPVDDVDILVAFGRGDHMNCPNHFDGYGGQLSHVIKLAINAEIHVDDDEYLTMGSEHGTNLVKVAVHEVGHALGLFHTSRNYSIMYAIYSKAIPNNNFELCWEDRKMIQEIYGICKLRFDTVFDWVRQRPDGQFIYNTYFFRGHHYWMYENRSNRTRYGDPLPIQPEWKGIPGDIDAFVHVWDHIYDMAYFFKGRQYYLYDSANDKISHGYPRNISQDFRSIPGSGKPNIPSHLDAVFFDKRDGTLYFFKGNLVHGYEVARGQEGCCLPGFPKEISEEYPASSPESRLPGNLDAVYYSYKDRSMYFFKGIYYWKNTAFNPLDRRRTNRVSGPWEISSKWFDICDVEL